MRHEMINTNGIRLHCAMSGEGPLLLLLHGFPECWYSWRHQIQPLADAGFHVVAPDLRGYNLSDRPDAGYDLNSLVGDVVGLIDAFGEEKAIVAGHDWGGAIAWQTAIWRADRVSQLIALNMPHPSLLARALRSNPRQMIRSLYILLFRLPLIPERLLSVNDYWAIEWMFRSSAVHPELFTDEDMQAYKDAARQPGALTAALNYYRAINFVDLADLAGGGPTAAVHVPTCMLWGEQDVALGKELTFGTREFVPDLTIRYFPSASHWVQQDEPQGVTRAILEYLHRPQS